MITSLILALISTTVLWWSYIVTKQRSPDNVSLHLLLAISPSFFLQSIGFLIFGIQDRTIDTIPISYYVDELPFGATILFFLSIVGSLSNIWLARRPKELGVVGEEVNGPTLVGILLFLVCITAFGLQVFSLSVGESLGSLFSGSNKWLIQSSGDKVSFESNGYARFLTTLGTPAFLFYIAYLVHFRKPFRIGRIFLTCILLLAALAPPALLSSRGAALYIFISVFFMLLIKRKLKFRHVLIGGSMVLVLFSILSAARNGFEGEIGLLSAIESRVFYGGGISLFNTSVILDAYINSNAQYFYGESYLGLVTALIPRSIWPGKPVFAYDQLIAQDIYHIFSVGAQAIPAGLPSESIMNFGIVGGLLFSVLLISASVLIHNWVVSRRRPFFSFLIRCIVFPKFIAKLLASGVGFAVMDTLVIFIGIAIIYTISVKVQDHNAL